MGLIPRCAWEAGNSEPRIVKILALIRACRYGIHDISMQSLDAITGLPHFNMLFELGLFVGCKDFSDDPEQTSKDFLVFDSVPGRFRHSVSDFAGYDIVAHNNSPEEIVVAVRNWLASALARRLYGPLRLQEEFRKFESVLPSIIDEFAADPDQIPYVDLCDLIREWAAEARPAAAPGS